MMQMNREAREKEQADGNSNTEEAHSKTADRYSQGEEDSLVEEFQMDRVLWQDLMGLAECTWRVSYPGRGSWCNHRVRLVASSSCRCTTSTRPAECYSSTSTRPGKCIRSTASSSIANIY